jgi:pimeloyl-ACP methyl ester carboxylesterase
VEAVERLGYQVARLPEASHFLFWEEPERCAAILAGFAAG